MFVFSRFAIVGSLGFIVDASIFYLLIDFLLIDLNIARIIAFVIAVLATWLGNRYFTFTKADRENVKKQLSKHFACACLSFTFNYAVFQSVINLSIPVSIAFISGVLVGMISNYFISKKFVFI